MSHLLQNMSLRTIVRKRSDKEDHFAHKALVTPTGQNKDPAFHHGVRDELFALLNECFPLGNWKTEVKITDDSLGTVIPDIAGYFGERGKEFPTVAVEVQLSPYSPSYIKKKTTFYAKKNIHVLWIVPLIRPLEIAVFRPRRSAKICNAWQNPNNGRLSVPERKIMATSL